MAIAGTANDGETRQIREFYKARGNRPAWDGHDLAERIQSAAQTEGLDPAHYRSGPGDGDLAGDARLTLAALRLGRDMAVGAVPPERAYGGFGAETRGHFDAGRFLNDLAAGKALADAALASRPRFVGQARLIQALDRMRTIIGDGGWPSVPDGPKLVPGDIDDRVAALRKRLIVSGELPADLAEGREFDGPLVDAVKRFQANHGLDADGTVGAKTLANLNVSAQVRFRQLSVNLERWRWMTRNLGRHHIAVNIPAATLDVVEDGKIVLAMRVVVGDVKHPTPSMVTSMSTVVLNPAWRVPTSIANKEILPKLRRDPNYLANSNLKIVEYPEDSPEAAGDGIDWNAIGKKFPYHLRQPPGPDNALGQLKFNLTESDDIYMHDTPNRKVFGRSYRALSHGCVRLEHPVELGELMLGARWRGKLADDLAANLSTRTLRLERTTPVHMVYFTAWADDDGTLHFRDDLYGHDRRLGAVLFRGRPAVAPGQPRS